MAAVIAAIGAAVDAIIAYIKRSEEDDAVPIICCLIFHAMEKIRLR
jgi:hypothetical protein